VLNDRTSDPSLSLNAWILLVDASVTNARPPVASMPLGWTSPALDGTTVFVVPS
jgi:hypothetical protein